MAAIVVNDIIKSTKIQLKIAETSISLDHTLKKIKNVKYNIIKSWVGSKTFLTKKGNKKGLDKIKKRLRIFLYV